MDIFMEGKAWEAKVQARMEADGWHVQPFGMDLLTEPLQAAIHDRASSLEHMPDLFGARKYASRHVGAFVDAKAGRSWEHTGRHCAETASVVALDHWADMFWIPVYLVFPDWGVTTPDRVLAMGAPGRQSGAGSGRPFLVFPRAICVPWDALLGRLL